MQRRSGFTLIELLIVLGIVALLLSLSLPRVFNSLDSTKDSLLAQNLHTLRTTIDQYYSDTGRYPDSLEQLVEKKYLRALPVDPVTESSSTWIVVAPEDGRPGQIYDIRSGAPGLDRNGIPYAQR